MYHFYKKTFYRMSEWPALQSKNIFNSVLNTINIQEMLVWSKHKINIKMIRVVTIWYVFISTFVIHMISNHIDKNAYQFHMNKVICENWGNNIKFFSFSLCGSTWLVFLINYSTLHTFWQIQYILKPSTHIDENRELTIGVSEANRRLKLFVWFSARYSDELRK